MTPKEALLESLLVERYARNAWWTHTPTTSHEPLPALTVDAATDNDITTARRRRELDVAMRTHDTRRRTA